MISNRERGLMHEVRLRLHHRHPALHAEGGFQGVEQAL